jgi:general secretion pathway protein A
MYEKFFGLRERPFDLTPNPRFMYFTPRHREALVNLQFGIESRKGVVVLVGEAGMGKTTVIRAAIEKQRADQVRCVYLNNPLLTRAEFIEFLANALELSPAAERSKTRLVAELASRLSEERERGATVVLLVDEAQSLSNELLEELRMLTNIETHSEKLVTLVLVGQPQLADRLNDERLGQLKQRIELRCTLSPFDLAETVMYIRNRVRIAGGDAVQMFTRDAIQVIHERSRGIPRSISVICENALVGAFAENQKPVTRALVEEVCDEFDLSPATLIADESEAPVIVRSAAPAGDEITRADAVPVATAQPSGNGNGIGYRDGSTSVAIPTGRRWWSFSIAGRRS